MLSNGYINCEFDSGNRLILAGGHTYTYNAEDVRIRNLCADADTTYTYNTNCKLSQLLTKTTNGITTKYVYGLGLIGEEKECCFKTYHFDFRGSTVAITDECGNITDTFKYDTYGKLVSRTGNSFVILGYNGRDGVVTDRNGLLYMRARYYSPDMRRFINADIISGEISNAVTLNRYAYANGNPVSLVDPFGLWSLKSAFKSVKKWVKKNVKKAIVGIKNLLLDIEYNLSELFNMVGLTYDYPNDYENISNDIKNEIIKNQYDAKVSNIVFGDSSMSDVGCEAIAVYNTMILLGYNDVSLADTIETFEQENALILQGIAKGALGSSPYSIKDVLNAKNINYSRIDDINIIKKAPGLYIVSAWTGAAITSQIHTYVVEINDDFKKTYYNELSSDFESLNNDLFVVGYRIEKSKEINVEINKKRSK